MLSPEVWRFEAPRHRIELQPGQTASGTEDARPPKDAISAHYFNHSMSVTFPNTSSIPESFSQNILEDSDYYRVDGLRAVELVSKEFIESFVKKGELSLLTIERRIDVDNVLAITPSGHLILSLVRASYQSLGIEGKPSYFERKKPSRYVVRINLKDENLTPGKKYYERIRNSLDKLHDLKFDVIIAWDPPEEQICPSSVASWLCKRGYPVTVCHQQVTRRAEYTLDIPVLEDGCNHEEFFEWLGVFSIDGNLLNEGKNAEYVSSYRCPAPRQQTGQIQYLQCTGFLTRRKLAKAYELLRKYADARAASLPWCSIDVRGFADSPVSWGLKEHGYYADGDNGYTLALLPASGGYLLRACTSSAGKPRITQ